jgi:hypothetical protein
MLYAVYFVLRYISFYRIVGLFGFVKVVLQSLKATGRRLCRRRSPLGSYRIIDTGLQRVLF